MQTNNLGIGTDIESIDRFRKLDLNKDRIFLNKIFTKKELDHCFSKKEPAQHLAVRYAGKEAVVKALTSINKLNLDYKKVEIFNNENGVPKVKISDRDTNIQIHLSLSHSGGNVLAFAIVMEYP
jgi:holo-[acyl-carrier protein] synthase